MNACLTQTPHAQPRLEVEAKQNGGGREDVDRRTAAERRSLQERHHQVFARACII